MRTATVAAVLALAACAGSESGGPAPPIPATELCVNAGCGEAVKLFDTPQAENSLLTRDGRLFVAGDNLYEITRDAAGNYHLHVVAPGNGSFFNGLVEDRGVLYAIHGDQLKAARLDTPLALQPIHSLAGIMLPNGITVDHAHRLYITDGPITVTPRIVRLSLDLQDPFTVTAQSDWLSTGLLGPNGITYARVHGQDTLFLTDDGNFAVHRVALRDDGSPGPLETLYTRPPEFFDDLTYYDGHLLVTVYYQGTVFLLSLDGEVLQETSQGGFLGASSVQVGDGRVFPAGHLYVTERGVQFLPVPGLGNALTVFRPRTP